MKILLRVRDRATRGDGESDSRSEDQEKFKVPELMNSY
jgi:hypothetical protein